MKRLSLSNKLRFEVFKRDGFHCVYCGSHPPTVVLECDHVIPVSKGGLNEIDNLVTSCFNCNRGKFNNLLTDVPQSLAERAKEVKEREAQIAGYEAIMREKRERLEGQAQEILDAICEFYYRDGIPKVDFTSIKRFVDTLGLSEVIEAVNISNTKFPRSYRNFFPYFCGICWKKIKTRRGEQ